MLAINNSTSFLQKGQFPKYRPELVVTVRKTVNINPAYSLFIKPCKLKVYLTVSERLHTTEGINKERKKNK